MKLLTIASAVLLAAAATSNALADPGKSRDQVKAELAEAIRTGDINLGGEGGLKENELHPGRYPTVAMAPGRSRAAVRAELAEAVRTGDIIAGGEGALKENELNPGRYPTVAMAPGRSRAAVRAELAEAIRTGDIIAGGELGLRENQLSGRYESAAQMAGRSVRTMATK